MTVVGRVEAIWRYPVKSMRGEALSEATLGWRGLDGDRRYALRRTGVGGGFAFLTASRMPELLAWTPEGGHVRTPEGDVLPVGDALAAEVTRRHGHPVELMQYKHGVFDEADVSVITAGTVSRICARAGVASDPRRFRPNLLIRTPDGALFEEDAWVGGTLTFGDGPVVHLTQRDLRCVMVNLDPDGGPASPAVMTVTVQANDNHAGVYGAVVRTGRVAVGQEVVLRRS